MNFCDEVSSIRIPLSSLLLFRQILARNKEVAGDRRKCIRELRSSVILIMDPWGCISHGVTARWSIGFLSSLRRDLRRHQAPMESHGPVHLPARSPPRWKLSLFLSLPFARALALSPASARQFLPAVNPNPSRAKEITVKGKSEVV